MLRLVQPNFIMPIRSKIYVNFKLVLAKRQDYGVGKIVDGKFK